MKQVCRIAGIRRKEKGEFFFTEIDRIFCDDTM